MYPGFSLVGWISLMIHALIWIIIIDAVLTWIPQVNRYHPIVVALRKITAPIYRPIHRLIPPEKTAGLDLSPLIAIIGLQVLWAILRSILSGI